MTPPRSLQVQQSRPGFRPLSSSDDPGEGSKTAPGPLNDLLEGLNPAQRRAAAYGEGPLLILAGAGTGKTRTLVARVAHLIDQGVPPERILLLTFTRRAAAEMLRRVAAVCGDRRAQQVQGGTFHAVGQHVLRSYATRAGLNPGFTILDRGDAEDLIDLCRESLGIRSGAPSVGERRFPGKGTLLSCYSRCVNTESPLVDVLQSHFPWIATFEAELRRIFAAYEERKQRHDVLDFDDLLSYWQAIAQDPVLGPELAREVDHVLVDEYQDTNRVQRSILRAMRPDTDGPPKVTVVGDDAQSIYSFRGATVENIRAFPEDFPGCEVVRLEQNYRSTEPILAVCNNVIGQARDLPQEFRKELFSDKQSERRPTFARVSDEDEQASYVASEVLERREEGIPLREQAVLFRTAHHSDLLEIELGRRQIPFRKFGGLRLSDAAHVKDVLAFLRVVENPADETAWFRVLKLLEGVGPKSAAKVLNHLAEHEHRLESLGSCKLTGAGKASLAALTVLLEDLAARQPAHVRGIDQGGGLGERYDEPEGESVIGLDRIGDFYEPLMRKRYERVEDRLEDLSTLEHVARTCGSRREFLSQLALHPPDASAERAGPPHLDDDWLVLSTIHSAKGLEWDAVTVLKASDGMIPSDLATGCPKEIEEERRLFYVALTRARRHLTVVYPQRYHPKERIRGDRHLYGKVSRFLPPETLDLFETVVREGPKPAFLKGKQGEGAVTDLRARARSRWSL